MKFSAFARFNGGFGFSSRPPHGRSVYESLRDNFGETYEKSFDGRQQARLYAQAMCIGAAQYQLDRAVNNRKPLAATELLPSLERDYQISPAYNATLHQRRQVVAARALTTRGARREAVEDALRTLLGTDFVSYDTTATSDAVTWPTQPGVVGTFAPQGAQKKVFRIDAHVLSVEVPTTVPFTSLGNTTPPVVGETYTVDPDSRNPNIEQITISAVNGSSLTATFSRPHALGAIAARPHPLWISSKRYSRIYVTPTAAVSVESRRKVNEQMRRQLRGVSQWCIVSTAGTFILNSPTRGILDATLLP